jgi:hypothetical protein
MMNPSSFGERVIFQDSVVTVKCTWLDRGLLQTKVRVIAGPHTGKAGYVPTEWASGR